MARFVGICHVGIQARDPHALAAFYRDVMEMTVIGGTDASDRHFGPSAFLSGRPDEENHELAIFHRSEFPHLAFKVRTLDDLRAQFLAICERGIPIKLAVSHGVSLAFYFDDPEGNMIEIYWPTGVDVPQPHAASIDLSQPTADLLREVARIRDAAIT